MEWISWSTSFDWDWRYRKLERRPCRLPNTTLNLVESGLEGVACICLCGLGRNQEEGSGFKKGCIYPCLQSARKIPRGSGTEREQIRKNSSSSISPIVRGESRCVHFTNQIHPRGAERLQEVVVRCGHPLEEDVVVLLQEAQEPSRVEVHPEVAAISKVVVAEAPFFLHLHLALDLPLLGRLFSQREIAPLRRRSRRRRRRRRPLLGFLWLLCRRCRRRRVRLRRAGTCRLAGEPLHEVPEVGDVGLDDLRRNDVDDLYLGPRRGGGGGGINARAPPPCAAGVLTPWCSPIDRRACGYCVDGGELALGR
ncbi:hypothetical protein U9M48_026975 [Paspalum notatum var. saurae]|uniref:Uncharacterized protein n=1 Tax=Paspalum notatum var. saurae TaxID=547442 RepID=A0AAQ3TTS2_PASNO